LVVDAELSDVFFLDGARGWAVGDRGVIWHTDDGGRHWRRQESGVSCRLESVWFVDAERGWAVGGQTRPYAHTSQAVVLRTHNGGQSWTAVAGLTLPALRCVRFFDGGNGWALGGSSAMYPTGVLRTSDGGRTWIPMTRGPAQHWRCGDFASPLQGAAAAVDGSLALAHQFEIVAARQPDVGMRRPQAMRLDLTGNGWLAGDGGLVLGTVDGGRSWTMPPSPLPPSAAMFDFSAVAVAGPHVWIAGSPGSRVFHSPDAGRTWRILSTGKPLPIDGLAFIDERRGWAVGALGTILATLDGGETWTVQRAGGERAALLAALLEPEHAPLELFAELCAGEGYLAAVEFIGRRGIELPPSSGELEEYRAREAMSLLGVSSAHSDWRFPLRQAGLEVSAEQVVDAWNRSTGGNGLAALEALLVLRIRTWRPDVVLVEPANPSDERSLSQLVNQVLLAAVEKAADSSAYPEQESEAGLKSWKVKKVFSLAEPGASSDVELVTAQLAPSLGESLADHAAVPRGLIFDRYQAEPEKLGFRLLAGDVPGAPRRVLFGGILLTPGGEARRAPRPATGDLAALQSLALRRRTASKLLEFGARSSHQGAAWIAQLDDLTRGLSPESSGDTLFQLAGQFHQAGQSELAAEVYRALVERYHQHHLADAALIWLVNYYASGEADWRLQRESKVAGGRGESQVGGSFNQVEGEQNAPASQAAAFQFQGQNSTGVAMTGQNRPQQAIHWAKLIEAGRPALSAEPALRFPLAVAQRRAGQPRQAEQWLNHLAALHRDDEWSRCADAEAWLTRPGSKPPDKPIARTAAATEKPRLDGRLDDAIWQNARPLELSSPLHDDGGWPGAVLIAHDAEYLYLAASCRKAPGAEYAAASATRERDADLDSHDRVDVLIDIDRDWATWYRLSIDYRGWTGESCLGDASWNPEWFVASADDEHSWTVEAAIPLAELDSPGSVQGATWAVGVQRTVPGVGFQSWSHPAGVKIRPEGFGLLVFE
jgi:photosystem II stability/assembly factor-like uncharacterized protein